MAAENDGPFERVLQNTGNIDNFVDEFFSFLARRTDFFSVSPPEGSTYGFPKGYAERVILSKFRKWQKIGPNQEFLPNIPAGQLGKEPKSKAAAASSSSSLVEERLQSTPLETSPKSSKIKTIDTSTSSDTYNGKATDKYSWSQSINEMDILVPINHSVKKGKEVNVTIGLQSLRVGLTAEKEVIFDGKLSFPIVKEESYWNLVPGEAIHIFLQKKQDRWWTALLEGEEPIDMKSIEAVRPMEDLDDEEQMKIQELMWNQERKRQGLPTSDEMEVLKTLEGAWNVEDSPFKGSPYDPSKIDVVTNTFTPPR